MFCVTLVPEKAGYLTLARGEKCLRLFKVSERKKVLC